MPPRGVGIPNSADRRAWLRSYHYYRAMLFEQPAGAEALELCRAVLEADGESVPDVAVGDAMPMPSVGEAAFSEAEVENASDDPANLEVSAEAAVETEASHARRGTAAGIHDGLPFFKEGRIWAEPWRTPAHTRALLLRLARDAIREGDGDLLIPDPPDWSTWTVPIKGRHYGIGSLRGLDVLRGMRAGGILTELASARRRKINWQIGPSGVIARSMKSLFPDATYVVTCAPREMPSAVAFLRRAMPDDKIRVVRNGSTASVDWDEDDFVFAPIDGAQDLTPPRLDLVIDAMALQLQDAEPAAALARHAFDLGSLYVYSVGLKGQSPDWQLGDAVGALEPFFWMHELPMHPVVDWQLAALMDEAFVSRGWARRPEEVKYWKMDQQYLVGWRRMMV